MSVGQEAENSHLHTASRETKLGRTCGFGTARHAPSDLPPKRTQMAPPTGDQTFKCLRRGTVLIYPTRHLLSLLSFHSLAYCHRLVTFFVTSSGNLSHNGQSLMIFSMAIIMSRLLTELNTVIFTL